MLIIAIHHNEKIRNIHLGLPVDLFVVVFGQLVVDACDSCPDTKDTHVLCYCVNERDLSVFTGRNAGIAITRGGATLGVSPQGRRIAAKIFCQKICDVLKCMSQRFIDRAIGRRLECNIHGPAARRSGGQSQSQSQSQ